MTKPTGKTPLPLPERVITWAAAGSQVTLSADSARTLARDAIRWRELREKADDEPAPPARSSWTHVAARAILAIAAVQVIDWAVAVAAWLF